MLLASEAAMENWLSRAKQTAQLRLMELANGVQSGIYGEWWDRIVSQAEGGEFKRHGSTAVIDICGALGYKYSIWSYLYDSACYKGIQGKVIAATNDASIDRIVLYIDSPGGDHQGCPETGETIWQARQTGKEVVAFVDPEAASAGYWMASQADKIYCMGSGWVGSLGSQVLLYSMSRMYAESGIDIEVLRAGISPDKNLGHPYEPLSDAAREERQGWVDKAGNMFVEAVSRGRGVDRAKVLDRFGQGRMFFADDATERGMIDGVSTWDVVLGDGSKKDDKPGYSRNARRQSNSRFRKWDSLGVR
ncbi:MAG: S49 family peptidase [Planctomycetales bacterium]|nr:S49 family peptidase [Planctomycetales bacterium]